jgi:hypothetical protein
MAVVKTPVEVRFRDLKTALVGARYHKGAYEVLRQMKRSDTLTPRREPDNSHDDKAVALYVGTQHMGYVPRDQSPMVYRALEEGRRVTVMLDCVEAHLHGAPAIIVRMDLDVVEGEADGWDFLD